MKYFLLISLLATCLIFSGCGKANNDNSTSSKSSTTTKFYSAEESNNKLLEYAITTGNKDSKVTIIEASDFECPACRYWHPEFKKVVDEFSDRVLFGYVPFPLSYHPDALPTAIAAESANKQGKGWEAHEYFFDGDTLDTNKIDTIADDLGLDKNQYETDLESSEIKTRIDSGMNLLNELNLTGTPTFYINGTILNGNPDYETLKAEIEKLL